MPNIYKRKSLERVKWTEEQLKSAMSTVKDEGLSVRQAGKTYGIPRKTLERRKNEDHKKNWVQILLSELPMKTDWFGILKKCKKWISTY
ncbi:unnamed protein product [Acanthoscelides obtectus]|uniref:HTH psq-type domain-containing protein n=1 Tax=Acanthoscelides obtectus TaxID=200917 RepID=A0A9P0NYX1_ACAOB|nr:unnamed protein product [Acanthoscelides obtectus]CAK1671229.1 hypothetical protein AOBTE_LOCUS28166 [Acanthoscelides obtectus]